MRLPISVAAALVSALRTQRAALGLLVAGLWVLSEGHYPKLRLLGSRTAFDPNGDPSVLAGLGALTAAAVGVIVGRFAFALSSNGTVTTVVVVVMPIV